MERKQWLSYQRLMELSETQWRFLKAQELQHSVRIKVEQLNKSQRIMTKPKKSLKT